MLRETIEYLPLDLIDLDSSLRADITEQSVIGLARSMQEVGLQQPIRVCRNENRFGLLKGARRLAAARLIKWPEIPSIIEPQQRTDVEALHRFLIATIQREDIPPTEKAQKIQRLMDHSSWSAAEAAGNLGISKAMASRLLSLRELPEEIRRDIDAGKIPMSAGPQLAHVSDSEKQLALGRQLADGSLTRDALASAIATEPTQFAVDEPASVKRIKFNLGNGESVTVVARTLDTLMENLRRIATAGRKTLGQGGDLETLRRSQKSI